MMKSMRVTAVAVLAAAVVLSGCTTGVSREQTGGVIGGALGGILGSQVGGGRGTTAAIIVGTLAGAAIGGSIGRTMDAVDRAQVATALEQAPDNRTVAWQNPNTGNSYEVRPDRTFRSGGRDCREYTLLTYIDGRPQEVRGTACRDAQGNWINQ